MTDGSPAEVPRDGTGLPRPLLLLLGSAGAVVTAAGIRAGSDILGPLVLAVLLTVTLMPLEGWARRHGWPGWAAVLLVLVTTYALVLALGASILVSLTRLATLLPTYAPDADALRASFAESLETLGIDPVAARAALGSIDLQGPISFVFGLLGSLAGTLGSAVFLLAVLFFTTTDAVAVRAGIAHLAPRQPEMARSLMAFAGSVRSYFIVSTIFGGIVAVLDAGALWLLGVPLPLLWGLLAFVTNFIPNVGFVIGLIPPALLALLDQGWRGLLAVILVYAVFNVVIQTLIQPRFVGDAVGLRPSVTFLSLGLWTLLLGPLGALLAVPMTLFVRAVLLDPDPRTEWAAVLLGSPTTPDTSRLPDTAEGQAGAEGRAEGRAGD